MRIPSNPASTAPIGPVAAVEPTGAAAPVAASTHSAGQPLQSAALAPALAAMKAMPEMDAARVAELRDALLEGRMPFDAAKLAGLIQRFHTGHG